MATIPTIRQTQLLAAAAGTVTGGFASAPLAGSLLLACTNLQNPLAWSPGQAATTVNGWRVLTSSGVATGLGERLLWRIATGSDPATYAFTVNTSGGGVQLVEVTNWSARWTRDGAGGQVVAASIIAGGAGATATAPSPLTPFPSGPSLLLAFWISGAAAGTANGIAPAGGWTEEYEANGGVGRVQLQSRAGDPGVAYYPAATFVAATAVERQLMAVAIAPPDDAASGGPLDLNSWSRGLPSRFL